MAKIIVLTPVKNEDWILEQFLTVVSLFADCIVIADQHSTDNSRIICSRFPKVHLIDNDNPEFNEANRQILLIETARNLFPDEKRIFFCLDADEMFSADSLDKKDVWNKIKNLQPGTSIYMEKPDLLSGIQRCVRWKDNFFPIGYIDDGIPHNPEKIHSKRIPYNPKGQTIYIDDIKILHFAHSRKNVQSAKLRYYSAIENINETKSFYLRRYAYTCFYDEGKNYPAENIELIPNKWLNKWTEMGIDLYNLKDPDFSWHDFEVLRFFRKYGYRKFYLDNIWDFSWEDVKQYALKADMQSIPQEKISGPGFFWRLFGNSIDWLYKLYRKIKG
jgi:hypothetical protein